MSEYVVRLKRIWSEIISGFSTFSLFPHTNYTECYHKDPNALIRDAWQQTGDDLRQAMGEIASVIEHEKKNNNNNKNQ